MRRSRSFCKSDDVPPGIARAFTAETDLKGQGFQPRRYSDRTLDGAPEGVASSSREKSVISAGS